MSSDTDTITAEMALAEQLPQVDASSLVDRESLEIRVKEMYRQVAREQEAELHFEVGRGLALRVGYPSDLLDAIPAAALASFAGVGYHLDLAALAPGDRVLDLGSVFAEAARVLRPGGRVAIADIVSGRALKERTRRNVELWAACIAGAIPAATWRRSKPQASESARCAPTTTTSSPNARSTPAALTASRASPSRRSKRPRVTRRRVADSPRAGRRGSSRL